MIADGGNSGQFLSVSPLFVNPEPLLFFPKDIEFYIDVIEVPGALRNCMSAFSRMSTVCLLKMVFVFTVAVTKSFITIFKVSSTGSSNPQC